MQLFSSVLKGKTHTPPQIFTIYLQPVSSFLSYISSLIFHSAGHWQAELHKHNHIDDMYEHQKLTVKKDNYLLILQGKKSFALIILYEKRLF